MKTRSKLLSIALSLALAVGLCPFPAFAGEADLLVTGAKLTTQATITMTQSEYDAKSSAFVNDGRWRDGVPFSNAQGPKLSTWGSGGCFAYACDFTMYVYGINSITYGSAFYNKNDIRQGDVIQVDGGNHTIVVLGRNGNSLYTAEGNYGYTTHVVRVTNSGYTVSGLTNFHMGWHYADIKSGPTPPSGTANVQTGVYHLTPKCAPDMHLDVADGSPEGGANVRIYTAHTGVPQSFGVVGTGGGSYFIKPICSGLLLDISGDKTEDGTNVSQWGDTGAAGQRWVFQDAGDGWYYVRSASGMYLDVANAGTASQTNVWVYSFNGSDAQKWRLTPTSASVAAGTYSLAPKHAPDMRLAVKDASAVEGANINIQAAGANDAEAFRVVSTGKGDFMIKPTCSAHMLDISGNSTKDGANVAQWGDTGAEGQRWTFQEAGDGWYYIRSASGMYLDVANAGKTSGTNVWAWSYNGSNAQRWKLTALRDISSATVTAPDQIYTGHALMPEPTVKVLRGVVRLGGDPYITLVNGTDYTVSYANNVNVGTAAVTVKGMGSYYGEKTATFEIKAPEQTEPTDPIDTTDPTEPKEPVDPVQPSEPAQPTTPTELVQPTDPTDPASPTDQNPADGTDKGDEPQTGGEATEPTSVAGAAVTGVKSKTYTGKALTQSPTVKVGGKALKAGTDYTLKYANNVKAGKATMTITGQGAYTGTKAVAFAVNKANVKSATAAKVKPQKYERGKAVKPSPKITYKGKTLKKGADYVLKYRDNKKRGTATITVKGKGNFRGIKAVTFKIR